MIQLDKDELFFPDPKLYYPMNGLMACGGDLSPERIKMAYHLGLFPWHNPDEEILWWCPDPRFVLLPEDLKVSKSMRKILKNETFSFTENQCFEEVMRNCMNVPRNNQDGTWISEELIESFMILHKEKLAKSIEVWQNQELVGGFYGIQIERIFCGESMFSKVSNASKAGFITFVEKYQDEIELIDCQIHSEHLESLGAIMISKEDYLSVLYNENKY